MSIIPFIKPPLRAIIVEPVSGPSHLFAAHFDGDEWTSEKVFNPPLRLPLLLAELKSWPGRNGLPILVRDTVASGVAA